MYLEEDGNRKERKKTPKTLVIMGSDSDYAVMKDCLALLKKFGILVLQMKNQEMVSYNMYNHT